MARRPRQDRHHHQQVDTVLAIMEQLADRLRRAHARTHHGPEGAPGLSIPISLWPVICPIAVQGARFADLIIDPLGDYHRPKGMMHLKFYRRRAAQSFTAKHAEENIP